MCLTDHWSVAFYQLEYAQYLEDPAADLQMLNKYSNVKRVFMKSNTPIPSSTPVGRLFNIAGLILCAKRNRLSNETFESLLLLKANYDDSDID